MKTAISIPDEVFEQAEIMAKRSNKSRSQLFCDAIREYLARHSPDAITEALNQVVDEIGDTEDTFAHQASVSILERSEW